MPDRRDQRLVLVLAVGLVLVTGGLFARTATFEFLQYDDDRFVYDNPALAEGLTADAIAWSFTTDHAALWIPGTWLSHLADVQLFGLRPGPHHLVNVLQHVLTTLLLFGALRAMTGAVRRSALVAALFAWHPGHVESVAWVTERKDTLSTLFLVAALWAYHRWTVRRTRGRYLVLLAWAVLGLLTKPMLVTLPVLLLLVDVWPLGRTDWRRLVREKSPLFALAAAVGAVTFVVGQRGGIVASMSELGLGPRLVNAVVSYAQYPLQMVWPVGLYAQVPFRLTAPAGLVIASAVFLLAVGWASIRYARRAPYLFFGWWWYVISLLPVSGLAQQGVHGMADRYTYVSFIGLFVIVAWGGADLARRLRVPRPAVATLVAVVLVALAWVTHAQVGVWRNNLTLFEHALARNPDNPMAHTFLGLGLEVRDRPVEAAAAYGRAIDLNPDHHVARFQLGRLLAQQGDPAGAVRHYEASLIAYEDAADVRRDLGNQYFLLGDHERAAAHLERALELEPGNRGAMTNLALACLAREEFDEAETLLQEVASAAPEDPHVRYNLACVAARQGRAAAAAVRLEEALDLGFTAWEAIEADPDLARLRASPEYADLRSRRAPSGR
ncbi:MAG: tetratricopeptide repeat protein [bacterium]|nr:tetratricopeptide repeat protein [bacterium]